MILSRRLLLAGAGAALARPARADGGKPIRIGILGDLTGPYSSFGGPGSVIAAQLAAEDFPQGIVGRPVEILSAGHQNKPDIAVSIARDWVDNKGVDAIAECATSGVSLALQQVMREKQRILLLTVSGSSDITGKACSPFGFHFNSDTYALARSTALALTKMGGDSWFFVTVDYAFGHAFQRDATRFVEAAGGHVLGSVLHPLGTADFSSYLLAAQASGAKIVAFANAGADAQNAIKQAVEFGIPQGGQRLAALLMFVTDIEALGLPVAQGLVLTNSFYWDLTDATRAWTRRYRARLDHAPSMNHAAAYSAVRHYLRARQQAAADADAIGVAAVMRTLPVEDMYNHAVPIREDGRVLNDVYLMQVKTPKQSAYPDDDYTLLSTTPGREAYRPLSESECGLVKK